MSVTVNLDHKEEMRRGDYFFVNPFDVLVPSGDRGRFEITPEEVVEMAESLLDKGQMLPVLCRRMPDNRPALYAGFRRTAGARAIREGFTDSTGEFRQDEAFLLKVLIADTNEETAVIRNIEENIKRKSTTPMDDALNQERLHDRYGKNDAEITRIYGYTDRGKVAKLRRLLSLPYECQKMVHEGTLPVSAALELLELPADQHKEIVAKAMSESGTVQTAVIRQEVREHILHDDAKLQEEQNAPIVREQQTQENSKKRTLRSKPLSIVEFRTALNGLAKKPEPRIQTFSELMLEFMQGKCSPENFEARIEALLMGRRAPKATAVVTANASEPAAV